MEDQQALDVTITVSIQQPMGRGYLNLNDTFRIHARDFLEMVKILGEFHSLAEKMRSTTKGSQ